MTEEQLAKSECPFCGAGVDQAGVYGFIRRRQVTYTCGRYGVLMVQDGEYTADEWHSHYPVCLTRQLKLIVKDYDMGMLILKEKTKCCGDRRAVWVPRFKAYCCPCCNTKIKAKDAEKMGEVVK